MSLASRDPSNVLVFINYRREDSAGYAGRLHDDLAERFPPDQLFIDIDAIPPGADFAASISEAVGRCDAFLALIGPGWLTAQDHEGRRRLDNPRDLVRVEIEAALRRDILVVPILLQGARMPKAADLPEGLRSLARRNALEMHDARWRIDFEVLAEGLARIAAIHQEKREGGESAAFWTSGPAEVELPYLGLRAFDESDARFFYGREADAQELVTRIGEGRFLAVFGPSGSGKSSLVRAGLVSALRRDALPGSRSWPIEVLRPGFRPLDSLAAHLIRLRPEDSMSRLVDALAGDERTLHLETVRALADAPPGTRFVRVVDQAEELFTLCSDERQRSAAIANLVHAATVAGGSAVTVLAMRADFYQRCAIYPSLAAAISRSQYLVSPMTESALRRAIEEPAKAVGLLFEPGLVDTIIKDVSARPGALPLLEHALLELFERRRGVTLTLEGYRAAGAVDGALAKRAESVYDDLGDADQRLVRRVLLRLTQPGEGSEDTRRRASLRDLPSGPAEAEAVRHVVDELADARLITLGAGEGSGEPVIEIAHEALIRAWPRVRGWIEEDREGLRIHQRIVDATAEWERLERTDDALLRGMRLAEAGEWRARHGDLLNDAERSFLDASSDAAEREHGARERRRRRTIGAALGLTVFFFALSAVTFAAWRGSEDALKRAQTAEAASKETITQLEAQQTELDRQRTIAIGRGLVSKATSSETPFDVSMLFALEGRRYAGADANPILIDNIYRWGSLVRTIPRPDVEPGTETAFSPDFRMLAIARETDVVLRDLATGEERILTSMETIFRIAFAPVGQSMLVSGTTPDGEQGAVLMDVGTGRQVGLRAGGWVTTWSFSADGSSVATDAIGAAGAPEVVVWGMSDGERRLTVPLGAHMLRSLALSRDGSLLAIEGAVPDGTVVVDLWDVAARSHRQVSADSDPHAGGPSGDWPGAVFSPTDDTLALVRGEPGLNTAILLREVRAAPSDGLQIEIGAFDVTNIAISPDGRTVAAAGQEYRNGIGFGGDGTGGVHVATAATDWRHEGWSGGFLPSPFGRQHGVVFTDDGRAVVSTNDLGAASGWTIAEGRPPASKISLEGTLSSQAVLLALAPQGHSLAITRHGLPDGPTGTVDIVNSATGDSRTLPDSNISATAFSPDGRLIGEATKSQVRIVRFDDLGTVATLRAPDANLLSISPDSTAVAVAMVDEDGHGAIGLWRIASDATLRSVALPAAPTAIAFSPDGETMAIATQVADALGSLDLWDVATLSPRAHVGTLPTGILSVAYRSDGGAVVGVDQERRLVTWELDTGLVISASLTPTIEEIGPDGETSNAATYEYRLSPDGGTIGSVGFGGWLYNVDSLRRPVDDHACALAGRNLTTAEWQQYLPGEPYGKTCPALP